MKFQNPSFIFFLNGRRDAHTHGRTSGNQYAPTFSKFGAQKLSKAYLSYKQTNTVMFNFSYNSNQLYVLYCKTLLILTF